MRRVLALMALVVALAACQKEQEQMDVVVGGEVDMIVNVNAPSSTRTGSEKGIFESGILDSVATMRYILQVFYIDENNNTHKTEPQIKYDDNSSVAFNVRLTPNRDYTFVVWADVVDTKDDEGNYVDKHYITNDLTNITIINDTWGAMDETRDAFTATQLVKDFTSSSIINLHLNRPNAKLRVKTNDWDATAAKPAKARVTYTTKHRTAFNAYTGEPAAATLENKVHTYTIDNIYGESGAERTLFSDYFFASEEDDKVKFEMVLLDGEDNTIKTLNFNTEISVKCNHLTTIEGNLLSSGEGNNTVTEN